MTDSARGLKQALGPGLLFAGAAIGVSHLVQATRAGATFGLALVALVLAANVVKYPAFSFGPLYGAATRTSLLEGYRQQGRWALVLYGLLTVATMFTVEAAVAITAAGLTNVVLGTQFSVVPLAICLIAAAAFLLGRGRYRWLDRAIKGTVAVLTVSTVVATVCILPRVPWSTIALWPQQIAPTDWLFLAALIGWMPSAIDVSVWHSLWTLAKRADAGPTGVRASQLDFQIGYFGTAGLALCFVALGAAVLHGSGQPLATTATGFSAQVIDLYASALGSWSRWLIGIAAWTVMASTLLTVVDGFPRVLCVLRDRFRRPETPDDPAHGALARRADYWLWVLVLALGSLVLLRWFLGNLQSLVDFATTLSFLTAPCLAWLNHRAIARASLPAANRPGTAMMGFSLVCVVVLAALAVGYLLLRFGSG